MSDFFREVDEDYRRDRLLNFWKRYGGWLIALLVVIVGAVAAGVLWRDYQEEERGRQSEIYAAALAELEAGERDAAFAKLVELESDGTRGFEVLSVLARADALAESGEGDEAAALYESLSGRSDLAQNLRDLAALMAVMVRLDRMPSEEVARRLAPLAVPGGPYYGSASEAIALAYIRDGNAAQARNYLDLLVSDPQLPQGVRQRVASYLQLIGPAPSSDEAEDAEGGAENADKDDAS